MNRLKDKGTAMESAVAAFLRGVLHCPQVDRSAQHGAADVGDIANVTFHGSPVVIEVKNRRQLLVGEALREALREARAKGASIMFAVIHRPGVGIRSAVSVGRQLTVMAAGTWHELASERNCELVEERPYTNVRQLARWLDSPSGRHAGHLTRVYGVSTPVVFARLETVAALLDA